MKTPLIVSTVLVVAFLLLALVKQNYEFLLYAGVMFILIAFLHFTHERFSYTPLALWGFATWIVLHLLGGFASIHGTRLYDFMLINIVGEPYSILKYDQVVHVFCYVVMALLLCSVIDHLASASASHYLLGVVAVLAAIGVGSLNEIIEFSTTILFASNGVGGYENTALDLVSNLCGAIIGTITFHKLEKK